MIVKEHVHLHYKVWRSFQGPLLSMIANQGFYYYYYYYYYHYYYYYYYYYHYYYIVGVRDQTIANFDLAFAAD
jgi:hypothetical protein